MGLHLWCGYVVLHGIQSSSDEAWRLCIAVSCSVFRTASRGCISSLSADDDIYLLEGVV